GDPDRLDILQRRVEAAKLACIFLEECVERVRRALVEAVLPLAAPGQRANIAHLFGIADGVRDQLALNQPVHEPALETLFGADPWIAATTGLVQASIRSTTCGRAGCSNALGVPNSETSAPAKKVWPSQAMTTALTLSSPSACSIAATSPCRTAAPSAFTGGLFDRTISTSPCLRVEIGLVIGLSITSSMAGLRHWPLSCGIARNKPVVPLS